MVAAAAMEIEMQRQNNKRPKFFMVLPLRMILRLVVSTAETPRWHTVGSTLTRDFANVKIVALRWPIGLMKWLREERGRPDLRRELNLILGFAHPGKGYKKGSGCNFRTL